MSTPTHTIPLSEARALLNRAYAFHAENLGLCFQSDPEDMMAPAGCFLILESPRQGTVYFRSIDSGETVPVTPEGRLSLLGTTYNGPSQPHRVECELLPLMAHFIPVPPSS